MSFSNVGGRKQRNIRDNLFVVYASINDVINGYGTSFDFQCYDVIKCFDILLMSSCMMSEFSGMMPSVVDGLHRNFCFRAHPILRDEASAAPNMPCPMLLFTSLVPDSPTEVLTEMFAPSFNLNHSL